MAKKDMVKLDTLKSEDFKSMKKPVIMRSSHPNDWHGFVGVVPTTTDIYDLKDLEDAVKEHESFMRSQEVRRYAQDEGMPYNEALHHLIQEQDSRYVGAMMRHPNKPSRIIIEFRQMADLFRKRSKWLDLKKFEYDTERRELSSVRGFFGYPEELERLITMYERIEQSGLLPDGWAYQVEFGLSPLMFFQARPFKKFQAANFDAKDIKVNGPHITFDDVIGITPPEGLTLPIAEADVYSLFQSSADTPIANVNAPYALIVLGEHAIMEGDVPITVPIGQLKAYLPTDDAINIGIGHIHLSHGYYRFMKRADVSTFGYKLQNVDKNDEPDFFRRLNSKNAIILSDGVNSKLIPQK